MGDLSEKNYRIKYRGRSVEISKANSTTLVYRIPYLTLLQGGSAFLVDNNFIVYILVSDDKKIYIGKSMNGLKNRPKSHDDKCNSWKFCYVLTQFKERTFFNDGIIQYIENYLKETVNRLGRFHNTTSKTSSSTANVSDESPCQDYIKEALEMLDAIGLDLITTKVDKEDVDIDDDIGNNDFSVIPNGTYHLCRKIKRIGNKSVSATMKVFDGTFIVMKGSEICLVEGVGMWDAVVEKRNNAIIENGILQEDVAFDSPSGAGAFVIGSTCNGWSNWKCEDGSNLKKFRK